MTDPNIEREPPTGEGEPSAAEGETAEPDPIIEDELSGSESDRAIYGSEGGGGDNSPAHPRERKPRA